MNEDEFIKFAKLVGKLKETKRTGWVTNAKIEQAESVADHSFRVSVLAMVLADMKGLDTEKIMRMSLLHDLEEAITGDIIRDSKTPEDKKKAVEAFKQVIKDFPEDLHKRYLELWKEQEECKTKEAVFVRSLDRIEMAIQASDYFEKYPDKKILAKFMDDNDLNIVTPETKELAEKLLKMGKEYEESS